MLPPPRCDVRAAGHRRCRRHYGRRRHYRPFPALTLRLVDVALRGSSLSLPRNDDCAVCFHGTHLPSAFFTSRYATNAAGMMRGWEAPCAAVRMHVVFFFFTRFLTLILRAQRQWGAFCYCLGFFRGLFQCYRAWWDLRKASVPLKVVRAGVRGKRWLVSG